MGIQFLLGWLKAHSLFSLAKANISLTVRIIFRTLCKTARAALFLRTISKQALQGNTTTTIQRVLNNHLSVYFVVRINILAYISYQINLCWFPSSLSVICNLAMKYISVAARIIFRTL